MMRTAPGWTTKAQQLDLIAELPTPAPTTTDREALRQAQHELRNLKKGLHATKAQLADAQAEAAALRMALAMMQRPTSTGNAEGLKRELLKLAHPDKWSQGQLATELAHEITVRLTAGPRRR